MNILGLHGGVTIGQHEPSCALIVDGEVKGIFEEERYLRIKSSYGYLPYYSVKAALALVDNIDLVVTTGITYDHFKERIAHFLKHSFGIEPKIELVHHQKAHLASAFYSSPFESSLCLSLDASGDGLSGMVAEASREGGFKILEEIPTESSLGYFYSCITSFLGFDDGDEYKVMGLAPYGNPNIDLSPMLKISDGGWSFDWSYIRSNPPLRSPFEAKYSEKLASLLNTAPRIPSEPLTQFHKDLAASAQTFLEEALLSLLKKYPGYKNLCYAGGVAMNCVANFRAADLFENVYIPPCSSDRGLALGCAYLGSRRSKPLQSAYFGGEYSSEQIKKEIVDNGLSYKEIDPVSVGARLLSENKIVGWFQGRSESGARALGNRSIIASAIDQKMKEKVNARIKYREEFRPFAPSALLEKAKDYFKAWESPYMCFVFPVLKPEILGAVTHVDNTARLQTVSKEQNKIYHELITQYEKLTGHPVILNTSFNLKGQPIVETPRDAIMTFYGCGLDALILGQFLVEKPNAR